MEMEYFVPPDDGRAVVRVLGARSGYRWYIDLGIPEDAAAAPPARPRGAVALLGRHVRRRVPVPVGLGRARGHRQPHRLRPHAAREVLGRGPHLLRPGARPPLRAARHRAGAGADRATLAFLLAAYDEEEVQGGEKRTVLRLDPRLAPIKVAVLPLSRNEKLEPARRRGRRRCCGRDFMIDVDDAGSIGRRYRRQDEVGTPLCVTVDFDTLDDRAVTVRDRDTMSQDRVPIDELVRHLRSGSSASSESYYELARRRSDASKDEIRSAYRDAPSRTSGGTVATRSARDQVRNGDRAKTRAARTRRGTCSPTRSSGSATTTRAASTVGDRDGDGDDGRGRRTDDDGAKPTPAPRDAGGGARSSRGTPPREARRPAADDRCPAAPRSRRKPRCTLAIDVSSWSLTSRHRSSSHRLGRRRVAHPLESTPVDVPITGRSRRATAKARRRDAIRRRPTAADSG